VTSAVIPSSSSGVRCLFSNREPSNALNPCRRSPRMRGGDGALALKLNSKRWRAYRAVRSVFDRRSQLTSTAPHTNTRSGRTSRRRDVRPVVSLSPRMGRVGEGAACEATCLRPSRHFDHSGEISCPPATSFVRSPQGCRRTITRGCLWARSPSCIRMTVRKEARARERPPLDIGKTGRSAT